MIELTWSQTRKKLLTRLSRLDPTLAQRVEAFQDRFQTLDAQLIIGHAEEFLADGAHAVDPSTLDVTEDSLLRDAPIEHEPVPEYLR